MSKIVFYKMWVAVCIFLLTVFGSYSIIVAYRVEDDEISQLTQSELRIARAQASNITTFFTMLGSSLSVFSQRDSLDGMGKDVQEQLDILSSKWSTNKMVADILIADENGIVRFHSKSSGTYVGNSLADSDYFLWAKSRVEEGEYFIGKSVYSQYGLSEGQVVVPISSPVLKDGVFAGSVVVFVRLLPLAEYYLGLMKISDSTDAYLVGRDGTLIFNGPTSDNVGVSVYDLVEGGNLLESEDLSQKIRSALNDGTEGSLQLSYQNLKTMEFNKHLVVYSPARFEDFNWIVVLATPLADFDLLNHSGAIRKTSILLLLSLFVLIIGVFISKRPQKRL